MTQHDLAITGGDVMLSDGRLEPLNVGVRDGRIASITDQAARRRRDARRDRPHGRARA